MLHRPPGPLFNRPDGNGEMYSEGPSAATDAPIEKTGPTSPGWVRRRSWLGGRDWEEMACGSQSRPDGVCERRSGTDEDIVFMIWPLITRQMGVLDAGFGVRQPDVVAVGEHRGLEPFNGAVGVEGPLAVALVIQ